MEGNYKNNCKSYDFHPCDTPRGMLYYQVEDLNKKSQRNLNNFKVKTLKDNAIYLSNHPEIRVMIVMILKFLLREKPLNNIRSLISNYFEEHILEIANEVRKYLKPQQPQYETEETSSRFCQNIVENIFQNAASQIDDTTIQANAESFEQMFSDNPFHIYDNNDSLSVNFSLENIQYRTKTKIEEDFQEELHEIIDKITK